MPRHKNKEARLLQVEQWKAAGEKFNDVLFTSVSTVTLENVPSKCGRKSKLSGAGKPIAKRPLQLHVWGGISRCGPGPLLVFDGEWEKNLVFLVCRPETELAYITC